MTAGRLTDETTARALLSLAAAGLASEVLEGDDEARAAVAVGRAWGRRRGAVSLTWAGATTSHMWSEEWREVIVEHVRATAASHAVELGPLVEPPTLEGAE